MISGSDVLTAATSPPVRRPQTHDVGIRPLRRSWRLVGAVGCRTTLDADFDIWPVSGRFTEPAASEAHLSGLP
jgi:hypothetical protein